MEIWKISVISHKSSVLVGSKLNFEKSVCESSAERKKSLLESGYEDELS